MQRLFAVTVTATWLAILRGNKAGLKVLSFLSSFWKVIGKFNEICYSVKYRGESEKSLCSFS